MRPIVKIKRAVSKVDPDDYATVYTQLAKWDKLLKDALESKGGSVYRELYWESVEEMSRAVMQPMLGGKPDWEYVLDLCEAYSPASPGSSHTPIVNAIGAGILQTRFNGDIRDIPEPVFQHLLAVGREHSSDTSWEDAFVIGWLIDHPHIDAISKLEDAISEEEMFVHGALSSAWNADQEAAFELTKRAVESPDTIETILWFECPDTVADPRRPNRPRYHTPIEEYQLANELDASIANELNAYIDENGYRQAVDHHGLLTSIR